MNPPDLRCLERGFALPFVMGFLLVLAMIMGAVVLAFQNASRQVGEAERIRGELVRADSLLEQARARLLANPWHELEAEGLESAWNDEEPCLLGFDADADNFALRETWIVTAVNRFAVFADEAAEIGDGAVIDGKVFAGHEKRYGDTSLVRAAFYEENADDEITADTYGPEIVQSTIVLRPESGKSVRLQGITILQGTLIVDGDVVLTGDFSGTAEEGEPLIEVTRTITCEPHDDATWEWTGVIASESSVVLQGPGSFTGTVAGHSVKLTEISGTSQESKSIRGMEPRIRRLSREEVWRK
ncbi:MAG: hypothetical protein AAB229_09355 [Candidatus Hydrogenedentota bacterium]